MAEDFYDSLDELKSHTKEGIDYEQIIKDRGSKVTILSFHGGYIENGTSEVAKEIAKDGLNHFDFGALKKEDKRKFHITAHKFYQEDLDSMIEGSDTAVSIHGCIMKDVNKAAVCIGGLNKKLKTLIKKNLESAGFELDFEHFPATYYKNVVNRAKKGGVQLELTYALRETLFKDIGQKNKKPNENFYIFTNAVRSAIDEYLEA